MSYAVSYLFIAIVWTNHHYLFRRAEDASRRMIWFNFAHLFTMSLLPFSTAWMVVNKLAPLAVAFYAGVFTLVNVTYIALIWELFDKRSEQRKYMLMRSFITLGLFAIATLISFKYPLLGLGICVGCLVSYLRPEARE